MRARWYRSVFGNPERGEQFEVRGSGFPAEEEVAIGECNDHREQFFPLETRDCRDQGLQIVGLAYEYTDDTPRNLKQIEIYRAKFGITFPLLLTGTTDQGQIAKTLPQLEGFGAFPTSIFIDRSGHVHAILAGFTGPSTGEKYQEVQQRMDQLVREIVAAK